MIEKAHIFRARSIWEVVRDDPTPRCNLNPLNHLAAAHSTHPSAERAGADLSGEKLSVSSQSDMNLYGRDRQKGETTTCYDTRYRYRLVYAKMNKRFMPELSASCLISRCGCGFELQWRAAEQSTVNSFALINGNRNKMGVCASVVTKSIAAVRTRPT